MELEGVWNCNKMAALNKMALVLYVALQVACAHTKLNTVAFGQVDSSDSISDDDKLRKGQAEERYPRRAGQQWEYAGNNVEVTTQKHSRKATSKKHSRKATVQTTLRTTSSTTTSTTPPPPPVFPPLSHRYRRIYNADESADVNEFPFMAAILVNDELWCGGAIISGDSVLTAAHCLQLQYNNRFFREYVKMLSVRVGSNNATAGGEVMRVTELFFHPNYKPDTLEFNFAVLRLHKNISLVKHLPVSEIQVARNKVVPIDNNVTFLGWGSVLGVGEKGGEVLLQKLDLPVYDIADCQDIYGRDLVTRSNFCAGYITQKKNVCNHDAGGPAVLDGALAGILSFSAKRCDEEDKPAVFSNTGAAADWLDTIEQNRVQSVTQEYPIWMPTPE
ncbi:trypsin-like isoform X2 [Choristoneura fumiferana]|uniref:trypsin-like isoform X2 n=1 Tax=Choristoneura fumiferana TaxID=7141 RepID=UPI003D15DB88